MNHSQWIIDARTLCQLSQQDLRLLLGKGDGWVSARECGTVHTDQADLDLIYELLTSAGYHLTKPTGLGRIGKAPIKSPKGKPVAQPINLRAAIDALAAADAAAQEAASEAEQLRAAARKATVRAQQAASAQRAARNRLAAALRAAPALAADKPLKPAIIQQPISAAAGVRPANEATTIRGFAA
jgi:hypothetical protein